MQKVIHFAVREMGEVYALDEIVGCLAGEDVSWVVHPIPYNSDLVLFHPGKILGVRNNVRVETSGLPIPSVTVHGFSSDISGKCKDRVRALLDVQEVCACSDYRPTNPAGQKRYDIVVSNVKIADKDPDREHDPLMWQQLGALPYSVAVVPRHPVPAEKLMRLPSVPENIELVNEMGRLRDLCAQARLVVMGLIFSRQQGETEHNPLEATVNAHAIYGKHLSISDRYLQLYENSRLLHGYSNFSECVSDIPSYIEDSDMAAKLAWRRHWISLNRRKLIEKVKALLLVTP